jgi:hypothetical protein
VLALLAQGGAAKSPSVKHFCHLCHTIRSDDIALPNQVPCASCDNQQECECDDNQIKRNNKKCYHHPVMDAQAVQRAKIELVQLQMCPIASHVMQACRAHGSGGNFEAFYAACKVHLINVGRQVGIDDDVLDKGLDLDEYDQCMSETLDMLGVLEHYNNDTFDLKKKVVRKMLFYVQRFKYITDCLAFEESVATALVKVDNCVPCILHLHKRIIEKLLTMVFCASLDEISTSNKAARKRQAKKISEYINTIAYGTPEDPGNYQVPFDSKTGKIAEVKFDDSRAKLLELHLPKILEVILMNEPNKTEWMWCQEKISAIMMTLGQKQDFTDSDIDHLQVDIDAWNARWVALCGREGLTNYTHLLSSSHVTYYLRRFRNLYRYSNQGWEYQNSQMKYVYLHRTNRGGSEGTHGGRSSKMKHLGRWMLRVLWWMTKEKTTRGRVTIYGHELV